MVIAVSAWEFVSKETASWQVLKTNGHRLSLIYFNCNSVEFVKSCAIVYGIKQTQYFTQGDSNLLVVTNHKPLLKVFGDWTLYKATPDYFVLNNKLCNSSWFDIAYSPGKPSYAADSTSRQPLYQSSNNNISLGDLKSV